MLFFKKAKQASNPKKDRPHHDLGNGLYYTYDQVSNGIGGYRDMDLWLFSEKDPHFARCIIDEAGQIQNFPGFDMGDWVKDAEYPIENKVRFVFAISKFSEGRASVMWRFQPDGWYYADSQGYGKEKDEEIELYSYIDEKGNFLAPFGQTK